MEWQLFYQGMCSVLWTCKVCGCSSPTIELRSLCHLVTPQLAMRSSWRWHSVSRRLSVSSETSPLSLLAQTYTLTQPWPPLLKRLQQMEAWFQHTHFRYNNYTNTHIQTAVFKVLLFWSGIMQNYCTPQLFVLCRFIHFSLTGYWLAGWLAKWSGIVGGVANHSSVNICCYGYGLSPMERK